MDDTNGPDKNNLEDFEVKSIGSEYEIKCYHGTYLDITIPKGIIYIGNGAFYKTGLKTVVIPDSVKYIGEGAFSYNNLTSVVIPDSVKYIGEGAFSYNNLTSVVIPDSVKYIGEGAFLGNLHLVINYGKNIPNGGQRDKNIIHPISDYEYKNSKIIDWSDFEFGSFSDNVQNGHSVDTYFGTSCDLVIPQKYGDKTVIHLGDFAFSYNNLTSVVIPDSVKYIGKGAFSNNQLTSVVIPDSVTDIGDYAFSNNPNLTIECFEKSYAEEYAINNNIQYLIIK
jgi:hypothetical protein